MHVQVQILSRGNAESGVEGFETRLPYLQGMVPRGHGNQPNPRVQVCAVEGDLGFTGIDVEPYETVRFGGLLGDGGQDPKERKGAKGHGPEKL